MGLFRGLGGGVGGIGLRSGTWMGWGSAVGTQPQLCGPSFLGSRSLPGRGPSKMLCWVAPFKQKLQVLKPGDSLIWSSVCVC